MACSRSPGRINSKVKASTGGSCLPAQASSTSGSPILREGGGPPRSPCRSLLLNLSCALPLLQTCLLGQPLGSVPRGQGGEHCRSASEDAAAAAAVAASAPIRELSSRTRKPGARGWGCSDLRLPRNSRTLMSPAGLFVRQFSPQRMPLKVISSSTGDGAKG